MKKPLAALVGITLILGVDEVMDMARSALNLTGNGLAACVISRWEGNFREKPPTSDEPSEVTAS